MFLDFSIINVLSCDQHLISYFRNRDLFIRSQSNRAISWKKQGQTESQKVSKAKPLPPLKTDYMSKGFE